MEDSLNVSYSPQEKNICANCREELALVGYPNPLCGACREKFIKYPIPKWIYAFGAGVLVVMLVAMIRVPEYIELAMNMGKAQKAIEEHRYITAEKNLEKVLAKFPELEEAKAYMLIAASYNLHLELAQRMYSTLTNKKLTIDADVKREAEQAISFIAAMAASDTVMPARIAIAANDSVSGLMALYKQVDSSNAQFKLSSEYLIADKLFDLRKYHESKEIVINIIKEDRTSYSALALLAAIDRHLKNYDDAIKTCDKALEMFNREDVNVIAQKAKIELARGNNNKSAEYIEEALKIDPQSLAALEVKTLLKYFTGNKDESGKLLAEIRRVEPDSEKLVYFRTLRVLNGTETFN